MSAQPRSGPMWKSWMPWRCFAVSPRFQTTAVWWMVIRLGSCVLYCPLAFRAPHASRDTSFGACTGVGVLVGTGDGTAVGALGTVNTGAGVGIVGMGVGPSDAGELGTDTTEACRGRQPAAPSARSPAMLPIKALRLIEWPVMGFP